MAAVRHMMGGPLNPDTSDDTRYSRIKHLPGIYCTMYAGSSVSHARAGERSHASLRHTDRRAQRHYEPDDCLHVASATARQPMSII